MQSQNSNERFDVKKNFGPQKKKACPTPCGFKFIRFTKQKIKKYKNSILNLRMQGPVVVKSKPYIGLLNDKNEVVSCVWKDGFGEISMITDVNYRKMGLMNYLICEMINDVFKHRLKILTATPMNMISLGIIEKFGFTGEDQDYEFCL